MAIWHRAKLADDARPSRQKRVVPEHGNFALLGSSLVGLARLRRFEV
jgi:hypothetical protein